GSIWRDHTRLEARRQGYCFLTSGGLSPQLELGRTAHKGARPVANDQVVIGHEASQWLCGAASDGGGYWTASFSTTAGAASRSPAVVTSSSASRGRRAHTQVPPAASAFTRHIPPSSSARSRI